MGEKIDIDGVRFKVEADLSKLEGDLKKGESTAKKGGENLGKAAGQGFSGKLTSGANDALKSIENQAGSSGGKISGVFAKIGVAAAAAFAVDKVITFFKSAVDEAEKAEKASGKVGQGAADSFKKAEADIDEAIVKIKQTIGGPLLSLVRTVYDAVATILGGITKIVTAISDAFTTKDADQIAAAYQKQKKELQALGSELDRLNGINKRTADQEIELAKLKDILSKKAEALGVSYNELAKDAKNYSDVVKEVERLERARAKAEIGRVGTSLQGGLGYLEQQRDELKRDVERAKSRGDRRAITEANNELREIDARIVRQKKAIDDTFKRFKDVDAPLKEDAKAAPGGGGGGADNFQEQRFLDSRLRLETIVSNHRKTLDAIALRETGDERARQEEMADEEARQAIEYELGSLRQGYAQFIEDTHMTKLEALNIEADQARKLSRELLEAELKQAGSNAEKIQKAKEKNAKRLAEIEEAKARKTTAIDLESFAKTMNAANATTTGIAGIANAKNAGGAIGGLGGTLSGFSGFSDKFKGLGLLGSGISAVGGIVGTLSDLFGKSDAERQQEAEAQKRRDEEAKAILELQAGYQRRQLELAEANAKLPFENLNRQLRLIDIEAGKQRLSGVDEQTVNANKLASKNSALQGILDSQAGAISGNQLFRGTQSTPEALTSFLSARAAQAPYVAQFVGLVESLQGLTSFNEFKVVAGQLEGYRGTIPAELFNTVQPFLNFVATASQYGDPTAGQLNTTTANFFSTNPNATAAAKAQTANFLAAVNARSAALSPASALKSEITSDTSIAENLLSVVEQQQQIQLEIANSTKKTADNTTKLVETPQRQSSIIDISRGYTRSLGQVLNPGITNTGLPSSIKAAVLATDIQKSIQERSLDKLQNIETIQRDSRELLAIIAKGVNSTASGSLLAELESLYRRSIAA